MLCGGTPRRGDCATAPRRGGAEHGERRLPGSGGSVKKCEPSRGGGSARAAGRCSSFQTPPTAPRPREETTPMRIPLRTLAALAAAVPALALAGARGTKPSADTAPALREVPVDFSLVPPLSLNGDGPAENHLSIGVVARSTVLRGLALAPVHLADEDVTGVQVTWAAASAGGVARGVQLATITTVTRDLRGLQASQLVNVVRAAGEGVQLGGAANWARRLDGVQAAAVNVAAELPGPAARARERRRRGGGDAAGARQRRSPGARCAGGGREPGPRRRRLGGCPRSRARRPARRRALRDRAHAARRGRPARRAPRLRHPERRRAARPAAAIGCDSLDPGRRRRRRVRARAAARARPGSRRAGGLARRRRRGGAGEPSRGGRLPPHALDGDPTPGRPRTCSCRTRTSPTCSSDGSSTPHGMFACGRASSRACGFDGAVTSLTRRRGSR